MIPMTAVEGERAVDPPIDDEAAAPPLEQSGPLPPESRPDQDGAAEHAAPAQSPAGEADPSTPSTPSARSEDADRSPGDEDVVLPLAADAADSPALDAHQSPSAVEATHPPADHPDPTPADEAAPPPAPDPDEPSPPPVAPPAAVAPQAPRRRRRVVIGAVLLAVLLTAAGAAVGAWAVLNLRPTPPPVPAPTPAPAGLVTAVDAVTPAVLRIQAGSPDTGTAGTALVVTPTGDVVTNEHLVHGESTATLIHSDGRSSTARVVASDEEADLAWLRIDGAQGLPVVRLAGPAAVRPGEDVIAIGNALNLDGPPSITRGIVSAVGRSTATLTDVIQTDAAISSGSSGGALVDRSGTVVGITTEALVGDPSVSVEDIAFAIPAHRVVAVLHGMGLVLPPG
jgi:putative serine protease PepD